MQLNNVEYIPPSTLERPRPMSKWASTYLDSGNFLPKDELGHYWHLPTTKVFSIPLMILKQK